jgi:bile acid:Na+ symporter, BASS family
MQKFLSIINHRDFVLSLALVMGLILGEYTRPLAEISVVTLALVMVFATTGFSLKNWISWQNTVQPIVWSVILNFVIFGLVLIALAWWAFPGDVNFRYFVGFVLVASAPPGPSVIPFAAMLKGDNNFSVTGVFGLHLVAMALTPFLLLIFLGQTLIDPMAIFYIMVQLILIPLIISRFLRHRSILPTVQKYRETIIKWGFFLVITPIMGMSSTLFFNDLESVIKMSLVLIISMYILGFIYHAVMLKYNAKLPFIISSTLMMTTKSSAFSAVVAFSFFQGDPMVALPSAVVSIFVTLFVIVYSIFLKHFR